VHHAVAAAETALLGVGVPLRVQVLIAPLDLGVRDTGQEPGDED
jgi:hypothetical protein